MKQEANLAQLRNTIVAAFPELRPARFTLHGAGWDSFAVDADDRLIFKFPRHAEAEARLRSEAGLLAAVRPAVSMPLPNQELHLGPPLFSRHEKLKGDHLLAAQYETLRPKARERLAADMALFFAELHAIDDRSMAEAGAGPIGSWLPPDEILRQAWPLLPHELRGYAERTIVRLQAMAADPGGKTYGYFDGHGWNMAFDHTAGRLNGLYDFGDSGFGDLHQEFMHPNWISQDLTERIVTEYETLTGRAIDRERVTLLSGVLRLSELGGSVGDRTATVVRSVADWAAYHQV
jgi:aminoglycoside phosphotransferase (APT) family kinase protein